MAGEPDFAAFYFQDQSPRDLAPDILGRNQDAILPEELSGNHDISIPDVKEIPASEDASAAGHDDSHVLLSRTHFVGAHEKGRYAGISEHKWVGRRLFLVQFGLREHVMQDPANVRMRIMDSDPDARAQGMRDDLISNYLG